MEWWIETALVAVAIGVVIAVLAAAVRAGKPIRRVLGSGVQGVCALGMVNVLGVFTGVSLGLSWLSLSACAVLGIPGVIGMLLLKIIFPLA